MSDQQQNDGGAFWYATDRDTGERKFTKAGKPYMTGKITLNGVTVNANLFFTKPEDKKNPKGPDISISINKPRDGQAAPAPRQAPREEEIDIDSIPF